MTEPTKPVDDITPPTKKLPSKPKPKAKVKAKPKPKKKPAVPMVIGPDGVGMRVIKKRGRKPSGNYLPWEEAKAFIQGEMIPSRGKYAEWFDMNKPKQLSKYPYRTYAKEWVTWNDFLGTNNAFSFAGTTKWRDINEATKWAHDLRLKTFYEWRDFCKSGKLPPDIPARPDLTYSTWKSWPHWLGSTLQATMEVQQAIQKTTLYYIVHEPGVPENVLSFNIETGGFSAIKSKWERERFTIVKMFWFDNNKVDKIKYIVETLSKPYLGMENQRIVPNVWEIIWHLDMFLETAIPPQT